MAKLNCDAKGSLTFYLQIFLIFQIKKSASHVSSLGEWIHHWLIGQVWLTRCRNLIDCSNEVIKQPDNSCPLMMIINVHKLSISPPNNLVNVSEYKFCHRCFSSLKIFLSLPLFLFYQYLKMTTFNCILNH